MSYKIKKVILYKDYGSYHMKHIFSMDEDFNLPYVVGDFQSIVPKEKIKSGLVEKIDQPLFISALLLRRLRVQKRTQ